VSLDQGIARGISTMSSIRLSILAPIKVLAISMGLFQFAGCNLLSPKQTPSFHTYPDSINNQTITSLIKWQTDEEQDFLALIQFEDSNTTLVALTISGLRLFSLSRADNKASIKKSYLAPDNIDPNSLLNSLLVVYLPIANIRENLPKNWTLIESQTHQKLERKLMYNHEPVLIVEYNAEDTSKATVERVWNSPFSQYKYEVTLLRMESN
jgi:hypothetical protein